MKKIEISIVIVSYNTYKLTKKCIESIYKNTKDIEFEVIVVDNNSKDESLKYLSKLNKQKKNFTLVKSSENLGFGGGNNLGIKKAKGKYVLFLNSDTEITDNVVKKSADWLDKNMDYGICGCALKNPDGTYQGSGGYFPNLINVFTWMTIQDLPFVDSFIKPFHPMKERSITKNTEFYKKARDLDWVTGAFMLFRKKVLDDIGGFDEDYFMYTEEVDLCFRAQKKGWRVAYLPQFSIIHYGGGSSTKDFAVVSEFNGVKTFFDKHRPGWQMPVLKSFLRIGCILRIPFNAETYFKALKSI